MESQFLTVQEASADLNVTDGALRRAMSQARLPFVELYGRKLIPRDDLEAYKARTQPAGEKRVGRPRKVKVGQDIVRA